MLQVNFEPFPVLHTGRLLLREVTDADAADLFALRSDGRVMNYIDRPMASTIDDALGLIKVITQSLKKREGITWAICLRDDPKLAGTIGFWTIDITNRRAEIGYLLSPALHGKGLMQEGVQEVLNYGFELLNLHSVEANVNPQNTASIRLLERNNFVREALFRENHFYNGKFLDTAVYSLLRRDFRMQNLS